MYECVEGLLCLTSRIIFILMPSENMQITLCHTSPNLTFFYDQSKYSEEEKMSKGNTVLMLYECAL